MYPLTVNYLALEYQLFNASELRPGDIYKSSLHGRRFKVKAVCDTTFGFITVLSFTIGKNDKEITSPRIRTYSDSRIMQVKRLPKDEM